MASTFSSDLKLEIITTGEKAGQWGGITNTNLQILEQGSSGVLDVDMASADVTLLLTDGATSNGKNAYLRLTGTLAANRTITMPSGTGVTRVWVMKDDTVRGTSNRPTTRREKIMTKIVVRLPEPKKEYSEDNQRQINRALTSMIEQLNSTYLTENEEEKERFSFFFS